jgi:anti-sigma factor RsiW
MTEDERFFAWLDGELPPAEAAAFAAKVASDPRLAGLARRHRALGADLKSAFDSIDDASDEEGLRA